MSTQSTALAGGAQPSGLQRAAAVLSQVWAWLFLALLLIVFSLSAPGFFSLFNFQSIGANLAILLIMALGQTFVIISGGIDLSSGFIMGLASVAGAMAMVAMPAGTPLALIVVVGLLAGIGVGIIPGFINGVLIAYLRVPPFIVTLGMFGIARGMGFILSGGMPVPASIPNLGRIGNGYLAYFFPGRGINWFAPHPGIEGVELRQIVGILPHPLTLILVLSLIFHWLLTRSRFGLYTYAIGGNEEAAVRAGIPVARHTIVIYMLSAGCAALAGVLYNVRFTNGAANAGEALLLDSIAAVVIGGASLFGGAGTIVGTVIGVLIIAVIQNGLVILGINPFWQFVAVGVVIILAVLVDQARAKIAR